MLDDMEPIRPSSRTHGVRYAIRDIVVLANELADAGRDMLWLNIGDPIKFDFETPPHVVEAIHQAMLAGETGYAPASGTGPALEAIHREAGRKGIDQGSIRHTFVTTGASEAIELALTALLEPGDDLLVPSPGYPLYTAILAKLGAVRNDYYLDEDNGWQPNIDDIASRIGPRTRGIVLINPNNPTGALCDTATLDALVELAAHHGLPLLTDEIYDKLTFDGREHVALASRAGDHPVLTFGGLAKCFLGPGLRIGWGVLSGPDELVDDYAEAIQRLERARLCCSHPAQGGVPAALDGPMDHLADAIARLQHRRDLVTEGLGNIPGISCVRPGGAFYAFPRLHDVDNDERFVADLMRATGIVCVHGSGFGQRPGTSHLRFVFLPPPEVLERAMGRLADFMASR
jgi:alanine-synthesizing transaminase